MYIRHTEEYVAQINEESLIEIIKKHLIQDNYSLKYDAFKMVDFEPVLDDKGKITVIVRFEKILKETKEEDNSDKSE